MKVGCVKDSLMETKSAMDTEKKTTTDQWRRRQLSWALNAENSTQWNWGEVWEKGEKGCLRMN